MFWKASLSIFLLLLPTEICSYVCPNTTVNVKFQGVPYFFPAQGADDHYAAHQTCRWNIQIPDGYYVHWGFHLNNRADSSFSYEIDYNPSPGKDESYWEGTWDVVYDTVAEKMNLWLYSESDDSGTFRFNVTWLKKVPPTTTTPYLVQDYSYYIIDLSTFKDQNTQTYTIAGDTNMQANSVCTDDDYLTEVWINYGTTADLTNHLTLWDDELDLDTYNQSLTLYSPVQNPQLDNCITILNDVRNLAAFDYYTVHSTLMPFPGEIVTTSDSPDAETEYNPNGPVVLYSITWNRGPYSSIRAYYGVPTPMTLEKPDVVFPANDSSKMPYTFDSDVVTFVMDKGSVEFNTQPSYPEAAKSISKRNRKLRKSFPIEKNGQRRTVIRNKRN